ncbi:E3 ubiquitin-protein ligase TRIM11-like [Porphyrio hochstetteri]
MAAAQDLREEASCSICLDLFSSPVMLDCGHNFCRACISLCWDRAAPSCPQCRETFPSRSLRPNRPLGNIAEWLRRLGPPGEGDPRERAHSTHTRCGGIPQGSLFLQEQIQLQLESLRREKGELEKQQRKEQQICQDHLEKVKAEQQKVVPEFKKLRQFLEDQEDLMLAWLGKLEEQIKTRLKEDAAKFSKEIIYLDGLIKEKERQLSGHKSLQEGLKRGLCDSRGERAKLQQKDQMSHKLLKKPGICSERAPTLEETARKPQEALTAATGAGVEESWALYTRVTVTLDPDTAQPQLILSEDGRSVMPGAPQQSRLDSPKRFDPWPCVLGCEGFGSGRVCWEVEVVCGSCWAVGVALESVKRKGTIDMRPEGGIWALGQYREMFQALTFPHLTPLLPHVVPRRLRVCLDHARGSVMFVNVDSKAVIFTFLQDSFAGERVHPWFWVGKGSQLKLS